MPDDADWVARWTAIGGVLLAAGNTAYSVSRGLWKRRGRGFEQIRGHIATMREGLSALAEEALPRRMLWSSVYDPPYQTLRDSSGALSDRWLRRHCRTLCRAWVSARGASPAGDVDPRDIGLRRSQTPQHAARIGVGACDKALRRLDRIGRHLEG